MLTLKPLEKEELREGGDMRLLKECNPSKVCSLIEGFLEPTYPGFSVE